MNHYQYHQHLHHLWQQAVSLYAAGQRGAATFFTAEDTSWLAAVGLHPQEIYDFAEDWNHYGEPDFLTFALIQDVRRAYFLEVQKGLPSTETIAMTSLPAKTEAARGIVWLPRIVPKARAKLRGAMPAELMYGCGGDRQFFKTHDIHPAEFLRLVWAWDEDTEALYDWVARRSKA